MKNTERIMRMLQSVQDIGDEALNSHELNITDDAGVVIEQMSEQIGAIKAAILLEPFNPVFFEKIMVEIGIIQPSEFPGTLYIQYMCEKLKDDNVLPIEVMKSIDQYEYDSRLKWMCAGAVQVALSRNIPVGKMRRAMSPEVMSAIEMGENYINGLDMEHHVKDIKSRAKKVWNN